ncbi:MAG: hypothetical protein WAX44_02670 [Minisyncoccia bacterium]
MCRRRGIGQAHQVPEQNLDQTQDHGTGDQEAVIDRQKAVEEAEILELEEALGDGGVALVRPRLM